MHDTFKILMVKVRFFSLLQDGIKQKQSCFYGTFKVLFEEEKLHMMWNSEDHEVDLRTVKVGVFYASPWLRGIFTQALHDVMATYAEEEAAEATRCIH